jgi:hypothetical protein
MGNGDLILDTLPSEYYIITAEAWVAELVDARDLKSLGPSGCAGSIPAPGTITIKGLAIFGWPFFSIKIINCNFHIHSTFNGE